MISGAQDAIGVANIDATQKLGLLQRLTELDADYVVLDLGAGTSLHTIDFFLFADIGLVTLLPEPPSIENASRFIKSTYYRRLWLARSLRPLRPMIEAA